MFTMQNGDLFAEVEHGYIVHGCNAQGVMGSGFAKLVRDKYPVAYQTYMNQADTGYILGEVIPAIVEPRLVIVNAITQEFYGTDRVHVDYDAVAQALEGVKHLAETGMIESNDVHFPLIGGGLAGGDQFRLVEIFGAAFGDSDVNGTLWLYSP